MTQIKQIFELALTFLSGQKLNTMTRKFIPEKYIFYCNELKYKKGKCLAAKENTQNCYA